MLSCLITPSCEDLVANRSSFELNNVSDTHSLNTDMGVSQCSPEAVEKMKFEKTYPVTRLSLNMMNIGYDIANTILELQRQKLELHGQKKLVKKDCRLSALCINTFSLKSVLQSKVAENIGYIVDFMSVDQQEIMYLQRGLANFIQNQNYCHFQQANIHIDLNNETSHLIFTQSSLERKLTNRANGTCLCRKCRSMSNLRHKQLIVERKLRKLVLNFMEIIEAMEMIFSLSLQSCLNAYEIGSSCLFQDRRRKKRSLFASSDTHDQLRRVTNVFENIFKSILSHEKVRERELQGLKHNIKNDEHSIQEIRAYLKGLKVIGQLHRK